MANIAKANTAEISENNVFDITDGYICTLDTNTDEGKIAIAKALNGANPLSKHTGEVFTLKGVITTPGERSVSGEKCVNTYLIADVDGTEEVYFSQSDGVARSIRVIAALWGAQLKDGGTVEVKCIEQDLNNGRSMKTIVPA